MGGTSTRGRRCTWQPGPATPELLRTHGVNVGACAKDDTCALHFACLKGHTEVARQLLAKGANVNAKTRKNVTPLMMAAQKGEQDLVDLLLKRKADPLVRSKKGESALDVAKTSVYDAIKEASTRAKENARKDGAGKASGHQPPAKVRKQDDADAGGKDEDPKPVKKKKKVVHLSHLDDEE